MIWYIVFGIIAFIYLRAAIFMASNPTKGFNYDVDDHNPLCRGFGYEQEEDANRS